MLAAVEWNRLLEPPIGAILFGTVAGVANFAVIGYFWLRSREVRLKQEMVERGFSAAEIERVMRATTPQAPPRRADYPAAPHPSGSSG